MAELGEGPSPRASVKIRLGERTTSSGHCHPMPGCQAALVRSRVVGDTFYDTEFEVRIQGGALPIFRQPFSQSAPATICMSLETRRALRKEVFPMGSHAGVLLTHQRHSIVIHHIISRKFPELFAKGFLNGSKSSNVLAPCDILERDN